MINTLTCLTADFNEAVMDTSIVKKEFRKLTANNYSSKNISDEVLRSIVDTDILDIRMCEHIYIDPRCTLPQQQELLKTVFACICEHTTFALPVNTLQPLMFTTLTEFPDESDSFIVRVKFFFNNMPFIGYRVWLPIEEQNNLVREFIDLCDGDTNIRLSEPAMILALSILTQYNDSLPLHSMPQILRSCFPLSIFSVSMNDSGNLIFMSNYGEVGAEIAIVLFGESIDASEFLNCMIPADIVSDLIYRALRFNEHSCRTFGTKIIFEYIQEGAYRVEHDIENQNLGALIRIGEIIATSTELATLLDSRRENVSRHVIRSNCARVGEIASDDILINNIFELATNLGREFDLPEFYYCIGDQIIRTKLNPNLLRIMRLSDRMSTVTEIFNKNEIRHVSQSVSHMNEMEVYSEIVRALESRAYGDSPLLVFLAALYRRVMAGENGLHQMLMSAFEGMAFNGSNIYVAPYA